MEISGSICLLLTPESQKYLVSLIFKLDREIGYWQQVLTRKYNDIN